MFKSMEELNSAYAKVLAVAAVAVSAISVGIAYYVHKLPDPLQLFTVTSSRSGVVYMVVALNEEDVAAILLAREVTYDDIQHVGVALDGAKAADVVVL